MTADLSPNTQAILLLTAPLIVGHNSHAEAPLTAKEYNRLAIRLRDTQHQPADLLAHGGDEALKDCRSVVDESRVRRLLDRGFQLSQAVERWHSRAIWVMSRADSAYPRRLKYRLKEVAPPVLYGCGDAEILGTGGLAVVGSRHVNDTLIEYTEAIGRLAAAAGQTIVSGGAKGIDQAAMSGALRGPGKVIGVLADSLEKAALNREHRKMLLDRWLVLISPYDPGAPFNVGHAMQRNKLIYALADAALVVNSDVDKGGTWAGATEQLEKLNFVRVYVRSTGDVGSGLQALRAKGALPWPDPRDADQLTALLRGPAEVRHASTQDELPFAAHDAAETAELATDHSDQPKIEIQRVGMGLSGSAVAELVDTIPTVGSVVKALRNAARDSAEGRQAAWTAWVVGSEHPETEAAFARQLEESLNGTDGAVVRNAVLESARAAVDAIDESVVPSIGLLTRRFLRTRTPDLRTYRAAMAMIRSLDREEFQGMRAAVHILRTIDAPILRTKIKRGVPSSVEAHDDCWIWYCVDGHSDGAFIELLRGDVAPRVVSAIEPLTGGHHFALDQSELHRDRPEFSRKLI